MSELHSNIYFKHPEADVMKRIKSFFMDCNGDEDKLTSIAASINEKDGAQLAYDLITSVGEPEHNLDAESIQMTVGYSVAHFVHGGNGDDIVEDIIEFLYALSPGIHAQAWGYGDDDPWEFWFKHENGNIVRKDDEPLTDEEEHEEIRNSIYAWWHETMPESLNEGILNNENTKIDLDDKYMVFTGKMTHGTRDEMGNIAEDYGANVQNSLNKKTDILVVGDRPGVSKLDKAKALGVKVISEEEFYELVDVDTEEDENNIALLSDFPGFESLNNINTYKASDILSLIKKDSFATIPFSYFKELSDTGKEAQQDLGQCGISVSERGASIAIFVEDDDGGLDVDFTDVASVAVELGLIRKEIIKETIQKGYHLFPEGTEWKWESSNFKFKLSISLSPHASRRLYYSFKYRK